MKLLRCLLLFILELSQCPESSALDKIPPKLNQQFIGKSTLSVMLTLEHSVNHVFNSIKARRFANSDERTTALVTELQAHTANSQKHVLDHLSRKSSFGKVTPYWITNKISIEKATRASILELLDAHGPSIKDVQTLKMIFKHPSTSSQFEDEYEDFETLESDKGLSGTTLGQGAFKPGGGSGGKPNGKPGGGRKPNAGEKPVFANAALSPSTELGSIEPSNGLAGPGLPILPGGGPVNPGDESIMENWGRKNIGADIANQAGYDGKGSVVGIIDSGVRWTHEVLRNNMRPTYNWFDIFNGSYYSKPVDFDGHGTHCAGIAVGGLGIGVAPGSQWIACRIFYDEETGGTADADILPCCQWMLCPTLVDGSNPDCSKRPHVVSSSWGGGQMDPFFYDVLAAWHIADITPVFSAGNSGPGCNTAISPGDARGVIGVGCSNINNKLTAFSSLGPTYEINARIKPDICAPGRKINSASYVADNQYLVESGTSMACPQMAGAVAVYRQKYPDATFTQILEAFQNTAYQWRMSDDACNYKSTNATVKWPNNYCGYGIIRLNAALGLTGKPTGGSGWNN